MPLIQIAVIVVVSLCLVLIGGVTLGPLLLPVLVGVSVLALVGAPVYFWVKGEKDKAVWSTLFSALVALNVLVVPFVPILYIGTFPANIYVAVMMFMSVTSRPAP